MVLIARAVHLLDAALNDVRDLVAVGRVVVDHCGVGRCQQRRVTVHVLQTLTGQRGAAGGGTNDEATRQLVRGCPEHVTGALEPEHRVEDVERDHRYALGGVGGAGSGERCNGAVLVDTRVQDDALLGLLVGEHEFAVHGEVVLPVGVVDLGGREERVHTEGTGFIGNDRHDPLTEVLLAHQVL